MRLFNREATKPLRGPYGHAVEIRAKEIMEKMRYDGNTIKCAQGFNTATWQNAIASASTDEQIKKFEDQGAAYVAQFK